MQWLSHNGGMSTAVSVLYIFKWLSAYVGVERHHTWAWNVIMQADVIVKCSHDQMEPIKCLELVVCCHQMSECLFGFFTDLRWEIQVDEGKILTHLYNSAAVIWGEGQVLLTFFRAFVSCLCAFIRYRDLAIEYFSNRVLYRKFHRLIE